MLEISQNAKTQGQIPSLLLLSDLPGLFLGCKIVRGVVFIMGRRDSLSTPNGLA